MVKCPYCGETAVNSELLKKIYFCEYCSLYLEPGILRVKIMTAEEVRAKIPESIAALDQIVDSSRNKIQQLIELERVM